MRNASACGEIFRVWATSIWLPPFQTPHSTMAPGMPACTTPDFNKLGCFRVVPFETVDCVTQRQKLVSVKSGRSVGVV